MAFVLTRFKAYGKRHEGAQRSHEDQIAEFGVTALGTDSVYDFGQRAGTFWTSAITDVVYGIEAVAVRDLLLDRIAPSLASLLAVEGEDTLTRARVSGTPVSGQWALTIPVPTAHVPTITFGTGATAPGFASTLLGASSNVEILAGTSITNTGPSVVNGDVAAQAAITPGGWTLNGTSHINDATYTQAQSDLTSAKNALNALTTTQTLTGTDLGGLVLGPGVYQFATTAGMTGVLTLDAQGNPNAHFTFKIGTALTTASASQIVLINGAVADNVNFVMGSAATLGTGTIFRGNLLAGTAITLTTGAQLTGRALASTAAVTLDTNTASVSTITPATGTNAAPTSSTIVLRWRLVDGQEAFTADYGPAVT